MKTRSKIAAAAVTAALASAGALAAASPALADYGPTTQFQVEISAGVHNLGGNNGSGGGIWVWAALSSDHSVDYQETDCVHNVPGATTGAVHISSGAATWAYNSNGTLTITGVQTALGPVAITVPDTTGHYVYPSTSFPPLFGGPPFSALPAQVQVAP